MQAGSTCCHSATQRSILAACLWLTGKVQLAVDEQSIAQNALQPELTSVPVPAGRERERGVMRKIVISKHSRTQLSARQRVGWSTEDSDRNVRGMWLNYTYPSVTPDPNLSQTHLEGAGVFRGEVRYLQPRIWVKLAVEVQSWKISTGLSVIIYEHFNRNTCIAFLGLIEPSSWGHI